MSPSTSRPASSPPIPPIPGEVLLAAAMEAITVPDPEFVWNPQERSGDGSVVNLDTWFWLENDLPTEGSVTAQAGPWSATVELSLSNVEYYSADAGSVVCADGGTEWTPTAGQSDCTLTFDPPVRRRHRPGQRPLGRHLVLQRRAPGRDRPAHLGVGVRLPRLRDRLDGHRGRLTSARLVVLKQASRTPRRRCRGGRTARRRRPRRRGRARRPSRRRDRRSPRLPSSNWIVICPDTQ